MENNVHGGIPLALTFDDILVLPRYSEILPKNVSTRTRLARNIYLNIPFISAAMDTVTERDMAIAMSMHGGIGIIHKNLSNSEQCNIVRSVKKRQINGLIPNPLTCKLSDSLLSVKNRMTEKDVHHFAVLDGEDSFCGMIAYKDFSFFEEKDLLQKTVNDLVQDCKTIKDGTAYDEARKFMQEQKKHWLPVIDDQNKLKGLYTWKDIELIKNYPNASRDEKGRLLCGAALTISKDIFIDVGKLVKAGVDVVVIDTAHGHSKGVGDAIREIKSNYPDLALIAGNVATGEGARFLVDAGADAVKVGVGPGSICTTRIIAGIGVPQISAIFEAKKALKGLNIPIIADGGIRYSGDVTKAIVAGADTVMIGSMFAGTDEAPGETGVFEGKKVKTYRGMGSIDAMKDGSATRYSQDPEAEFSKLVPEGIVATVPYIGSVSEVLFQLVGGLRAGMGYTGSKTIHKLQSASFVQITSSGIRESHPHDVKIIKESPNYSSK